MLMKMAEHRAIRSPHPRAPAPIEFPTHHKAGAKFNPRRSHHRRGDGAMLSGRPLQQLSLSLQWFGSRIRRTLATKWQKFKRKLRPNVMKASRNKSLKDKIQGITAVQNRTDAEIAKLVKQSPPAKSEIQGLQNHVNTLRREPKGQKR